MSAAEELFGLLNGLVIMLLPLFPLALPAVVLVAALAVPLVVVAGLLAAPALVIAAAIGRRRAP